jgi:hypothetical protein
MLVVVPSGVSVTIKWARLPHSGIAKHYSDRFFAARSIIEIPPRPLKLTEQAQLCLGKRSGAGVAAILYAA